VAVVSLVHGEIAGRVVAAGGSISRALRAEGITHTHSNIQFPTSNPNQDAAGNGGKYYIGGHSSYSSVASRLKPFNTNMVFIETLTRFSVFRSSTSTSTSHQADVFVPNPRTSTSQNNIMWSLRFVGSELRVDTCRGADGHRTRRATISRPQTGWQTYWVYARFSNTPTDSPYIPPSSTGANAFPSDAQIRVFATDPRAAGASQLMNYSGQIGHHWNSGAHSIYPGGLLRFQHFPNTYFDDCVVHVPSMKFVSTTSTLGIGSHNYIRYTDSEGNYIEARVSYAPPAVIVDGKATSELCLYHMNYYPAGGGAVQRFNGLGWGGGVTHPWGTGPVTITDPSGNVLGTGTFQYETSTFPRSGVYMPASIPITSSPTMTPTSGAATDSHLLLDEHGGQLNPSQYVYGDAVGEYWQGSFDDPTVSGTDKITVAGDATVGSVYTYQWGRNDGSGDNITGNVSAYNVASGSALSTRAESDPFVLNGTWATTVTPHPKCSTGVAGVTEDWTVANLNAAEFGIITK